jgi:hypothetical protein
MNEKEFFGSIRKSNDLLESIGLLTAFVNPSFLMPNEDFNKISLKFDSKYEEVFLVGLEKQYFNLILKDYSYFQFNFRIAEDPKNGHLNPFARYAFYPNPFEKADEVFFEMHGLYKMGELDFEDYSQALSEAKLSMKRTPVRYDLSFKQYRKVYHPAAHFHFGISENSRIATDKLFSPLLFTMFILNMYYINDWVGFNDKKEEYFLDKKYIDLVKSSISIKEFNEKSNEFFCSIQEALICLR